MPFSIRQPLVDPLSLVFPQSITPCHHGSALLMAIVSSNVQGTEHTFRGSGEEGSAHRVAPGGRRVQDAGGRIVETIGNAMSNFANRRGYATTFREGHAPMGFCFRLQRIWRLVPTPTSSPRSIPPSWPSRLGLAAFYVPNVPLHVSSFGDVGHISAPWIFME
jgi:hypothetical protein